MTQWGHVRAGPWRGEGTGFGFLTEVLAVWTRILCTIPLGDWAVGEAGFLTFRLDSNLYVAQRTSDPPLLPCRRRSGCGSHLETRPAPGPSTPPWGSGLPEKKLVLLS